MNILPKFFGCLSVNQNISNKEKIFEINYFAMQFFTLSLSYALLQIVHKFKYSLQNLQFVNMYSKNYILVIKKKKKTIVKLSLKIINKRLWQNLNFIPLHGERRRQKLQNNMIIITRLRYIVLPNFKRNYVLIIVQ